MISTSLLSTNEIVGMGTINSFRSRHFHSEGADG
jgi:hypothetical protein